MKAAHTPSEVKALAAADLPLLAESVRKEMLASVAQTGGHLASSLGTVELTIGLLRVFDPEIDRIVWDVGHQTYAWKILTGRGDRFHTLRAFGGISGFCNPEESPCDAFVSGHAGNALAVAEGLAAARDLAGGKEEVVAVVGDAAVANGESLEALNLCTSALKGKIVIVLNDNAPSTVRTELFDALGLDCIGPVDGHDIAAIERALRAARDSRRSVVVHVVTVKGKGFLPAEQNPTAWHGVGPFDAKAPVPQPRHEAKPGWSEAFGSTLCELARKDGRVCALTAAMREGTGLVDFAKEFPSRFFDVGICESQMVTFAAGLAKAGLRPVVALYSAFLQRAIDQVMHDVCLLRLPVVFAVDRAGCVGLDGRTHHGMFDIPMLRCLPNITIVQPRCADEMASMLSAALVHDGPVVIRYPKGTPPVGVCEGGVRNLDVPCAEQIEGDDAPLQIWALGDQVPKAVEVAWLLNENGIKAGVVNARFVKPLDIGLLRRQVASGMEIVTLENGALAGGFGSAVQEALPGVHVRSFGWPDAFVPHGTVAELESAYGLTAPQIAKSLLNKVTGI